jgi:ribosomal protein S18 acetylase RimI-like enzyme
MLVPRQLTFRRAISDDVPAIVALVESAYRGDESRAGWTTEAELLDGQRTDEPEVRALVLGERSRIVLAEDAPTGALVGSVLLEDEGDCAYVGMFAVRPTLQAHGVGRAILAEAERLARDELGRALVRMTVIAQRPELLAWYQRRGYTLTGRREPFPYDEERCGKPRRADLVFEVLEKRVK